MVPGADTPCHRPPRTIRIHACRDITLGLDTAGGDTRWTVVFTPCDAMAHADRKPLEDTRPTASRAWSRDAVRQGEKGI